jgi:type II restriction/modification system DNA methylase subunit YeeA
LEATEPVQDGRNRELAAAQHDIVQWEGKLQIEKRLSAKLKRQLNKCKLEPEKMEQTDITQLRLEKDMLQHEVKNLASEMSSLEAELRAF